MKVLFASAAHTPDMSAGFLWDGLQSLLGVQNVADATAGTALRGKPEGQWANDRPIRWRFPGKHRTPRPGEDDFDLLVATSTFLRDHDWTWLNDLRQKKLKKDGKFVWFETLDGSADFFTLQHDVDAVFKREIDPGMREVYARAWGHPPLSLLCGIPERWFSDPVYGWTDQKPYDVFNVSNAVSTGNPTRWNSLSATFATSRRIHALAGTATLLPNEIYLRVARNFKLIVEGPGGEGASDNGHLWEGISLGGIPLFVGQSCRPRWPWFSGEHCFWCDRTEQLPATIELALDSDLDAMRLRLREHCLKWHTTEKRAGQFLQMIEADAWRSGAPGPWRW
jgi:hypothetical protein